MFTTSSRVVVRPSSLPSLSLARSAFYKRNISPALASATTTTTSPSPSIFKPNNRPFSTSPSFQFKQSPVKMGVNMINTKDDFQAAIKSTESGKAIVIDCFATWCGPCVAIAPTLEKFSNENTNVGFYKVDVDESPDIAQELGVRAMPTFIFFKGGQKVETITGANPPALQKAIQTHGA